MSRMPSSNSLRRALAIGLIVGLVSSTAGCARLWDRVRENERNYAVSNARTQTKRGQCAAALQSLDRAQARIDLGNYARESTLTRVRCYEKMGADVLAYAHRRLVDDFYTEEPMALPDADGTSVFRVKQVPAGGFERAPSWLTVPSPRYSSYAQRSKIVGRVVVAFELASDDKAKKIRVLEMSHPLLATWAIEAISQAEAKKKPKDTNLMPGGRYVTTFVFEWRWAKEAPTEELDS